MEPTIVTAIRAAALISGRTIEEMVLLYENNEGFREWCDDALMYFKLADLEKAAKSEGL